MTSNPLINQESKIYVAGNQGLVGSSIYRELRNKDYANILTCDFEDLDLTVQADTRDFFNENKPEYVLLAAAKVGGILANNTCPGDFIRINLQIQTNVIDACRESGVKRLIFLGSSCIYPRLAPQPMCEEHLLTGLLEPTNEAYAIAKIAGITMCRAYRRQYGLHSICLMPTNLYGPGDNFDLKTSHVLPALIHKFHQAKSENHDFVEIWGSGKPKREFLYVDDLAKAAIYLLEQDMNDIDRITFDSLINVGTGEDIAIQNLASLISDIIGFNGELRFDSSKPDGTPRKLLDVSRIHKLGWRHSMELREGIRTTYAWYRKNISG